MDTLIIPHDATQVHWCERHNRRLNTHYYTVEGENAERPQRMFLCALCMQERFAGRDEVRDEKAS